MKTIEIVNDTDLLKLYTDFKNRCKNCGEQTYEDGSKRLELIKGDCHFIVNYVANSQSIACKIIEGDYTANFHTDSFDVLMENAVAVMGPDFFRNENELVDESEDYSVSMKR